MQSKVLILSHMRAGSSLLQHLIVSNSVGKNFWSRGESSTHYKEGFYEKLMKERNQDIYIDNVLHNDLVVPAQHPDVYLIVLVREPYGAINSMVNAFGDEGVSNGTIKGLDEYKSYYKLRIKTLVKYATLPGVRTYQYEDILYNWPRVAHSLSSYFNWEVSPSENYNLLSWTGKKGDKQKWIGSKRIVRNKERNQPINDFDIEAPINRAYLSIVPHVTHLDHKP